jgi:voltage-dependent calcium channel alpha-2/delta-4
MVIVVDVSGSMKGLRIAIAKHTIITILDTLGENDFVNIIAVTVTSCSQWLALL